MGAPLCGECLRESSTELRPEKGKKLMQNNLVKLWNQVPLNLRDRLDMGRKVNGDYSVHKGGYRPLGRLVSSLRTISQWN